MKSGLLTTRSSAGITFEVRRPNGQMAWRKFLRWGTFNRDRDRYNELAREQEKKAKEAPQ